MIKRQKLFYFLFLIIIFILIIGVGIVIVMKNQSDRTANWLTYRNNDVGYLIKYPNDFKIDEISGLTVLYRGEKIEVPEDSPIDPYPPVSLGIYDRYHPSRNNAREACEAEYCANLSDDSEVSRQYHLSEVKVNNSSGVKVIFDLTPLRETYYLGSDDGSKIVRVGLGIDEGSEDNEEDIADFKLLQKILSTFEFTK